MTQKIERAAWSKDFVEHLRMVHFSIVVLCAGLLIVTSNQRDSIVRRARVQLEQITSVASRLGEKQFDQYCLQRRASDPSPFGMQPEKSVTIDLKQDLVLKTQSVVRPRDFVLYRLPADCSLLDIQAIGLDNVRIPGARVGGELWTTLVQEGLHPRAMEILHWHPQTLAQFADQWNLLNHRLFIAIPTSLDSMFGAIESSDTDTDEAFGKPDRPFEMIKSEQSDASKRGDGLPMTLKVAPFKPYSGDWTELMPDFTQNLFVFIGPERYVRVRSFSTVALDGFLYMANQLPEIQRTTWKRGTFAESFPELSSITKDRQAASFKVWDDALREEMNRTADSFEAFGLKIPAQATTLWGVGLILVAQLYFLVHLMELGQKIDARDTGWEVAWIGVYQRHLARLLYTLSAILLPPVTVAAVSFRSLALNLGETNWEPTGAWTIIVLALLSSVAVAVFTFLARPKRIVRTGEDDPGSRVDELSGD